MKLNILSVSNGKRRDLVRPEISSLRGIVAQLDFVSAPGNRIPPPTVTSQDYSVRRRLTAGRRGEAVRVSGYFCSALCAATIGAVRGDVKRSKRSPVTGERFSSK